MLRAYALCDPRYAHLYKLAMLGSMPAWALSPLSRSTLQLPCGSSSTIGLSHAQVTQVSRPTCRSDSFLRVMLLPAGTGISASGSAAASSRMAASPEGTLSLEAVEALVGGRKGDDAATAAKVATACPELLLLERKKLLRMAKELRGMVRKCHHY